MKSIYYYETQIGKLGIAEEDGYICNVCFDEAELDKGFELKETPAIRQAYIAIQEYFQKKRKAFDIPLRPRGTEFQKKVWEELQRIPYGETVSYGHIAKKVDCPKGARAVGMANNKNPIPIFIPCHRVIGSDGKLVGYAGGLDIKIKLLETEGYYEK
ncbi:MAG: methylated-DNA--[protein]-cysteine S-methyltransferase [Aminipila sp.]